MKGKFTHILRDINDFTLGWYESEEKAREALVNRAQEDGFQLEEDGITCDELGVLDLSHISERDIELMHDEMLNSTGEGESLVRIGQLTYEISDVLKSVDPVAYRCSVADYHSYLIDDERYIEGPDGEFYEIN